MKKERVVYIFNLTLAVVAVINLVWMLLSLPLLNQFVSPGAKSLPAVEIRDRGSVVALGFSVVVCLLLIRASRFRSMSGRLTGVALLVLCVSIGWTNPILNLDGQLWFGFGSEILFATLVISLSIILFPNLVLVVRRGELVVARLSWAVVLIFYLPRLIQTSTGLMDSYHSNYVLNEIIGPVVHNGPLSTFAAQYSNLLGMPLFMLRWIPGEQLADLIPLYLSGLAIAEIGVIAFVVRRLWLEIHYSICLLLVSAFVLTKQSDGAAQTGALSTLLSAIPSRTFFPIVGALLIVSLRPDHRNRYFALGFVGAIAALNNPEFGLPSVVAMFCVVLVQRQDQDRRVLQSLWVAIGLFSGILVCLSLVWLSFGRLDLSLLTVFVSSFGKLGFGNIAMPIVGTYIFIYGILGVSLVIGMIGLKSSDRISTASYRIATYSGVWGLLTLPYYAGRSVTSGQLQIFLIPTFLSIASILSIYWHAESENGGGNNLRPSEHSQRFPLLMIAGLLIAVLINLPSPNREWQRVGGGGQAYAAKAAGSSELLAGAIGNALRVGTEPSSVELYTNWSNSLALASGYRSGSPVNALSDLELNPRLRHIFCSRLGSSAARLIVVEKAPEISYEFLQTCLIRHRIDAENNSAWFFAIQEAG